MSTDTSAPQLRYRRITRALAGLPGPGLGEHVGRLPSQVWPETLAARVEAAARRVLAEDQPLFESDQTVSIFPATLAPAATDGTAADVTGPDGQAADATSTDGRGADGQGAGRGAPANAG